MQYMYILYLYKLALKMRIYSYFHSFICDYTMLANHMYISLYVTLILCNTFIITSSVLPFCVLSNWVSGVVDCMVLCQCHSIAVYSFH